jgi:hypothetical protein
MKTKVFIIIGVIVTMFAIVNSAISFYNAKKQHDARMLVIQKEEQKIKELEKELEVKTEEHIKEKFHLSSVKVSLNKTTDEVNVSIKKGDTEVIDKEYILTFISSAYEVSKEKIKLQEK